MAVTQSNGLNRTMTDPAAADSDDIRRDIDRTRCEMDRTIDTLGERLRPRNLFDDLVASVRDSLFASAGLSCPPGTAAAAGGQMTQVATRLAGNAGRSLAECARENPVPAALIGAGLAWLLFEDKAERAYRRYRVESHNRGYTGDRFTDPHTHGGSYVDARTGKPYDESYGAGYADLDYDGEPNVCPPSVKDKVAGAASSVKETLSSAAHTVGSAAGAVGSAASRAAEAAKRAASTTGQAASVAGRKVSDTRRRVTEASRTAGDSMRGVSESAREYSHRTAEAARDYSHTAAESMRRYGHVAADKTRQGYDVSCERFNAALDDKPLAVGVAALAAGLLAGFALPRTRVEDRTIGAQADLLKEEAKRRGREVVEQGREVASHLASEAIGEVESQGLAPGSIGERVTRVAKDALSAAQETAQREGIDPKSLAEKAQFVGQAVKDKGKQEIRQVASSAVGPSSTASTGTIGRTDTMALTDTGSDAGMACGVGSASFGAGATVAGSAGTATVGGLSGSSGDMSSVKDDAEIKHDIAEGMSASSDSKKLPKGKDKGSDDSCVC